MFCRGSIASPLSASIFIAISLRSEPDNYAARPGLTSHGTEVDSGEVIMTICYEIVSSLGRPVICK